MCVSPADNPCDTLRESITVTSPQGNLKGGVLLTINVAIHGALDTGGLPVPSSCWRTASGMEEMGEVGGGRKITCCVTHIYIYLTVETVVPLTLGMLLNTPQILPFVTLQLL